MTLDLLTISRLRAYRACPRLHHYRYGLRVRPILSPAAARFGSIFHAGQEQLWLAIGEGLGGSDPLDCALAAAKARWLGADGPDAEPDPFELVKAEELLRGYDARWRHDEFTVIGVELQFRMPLVNPDTGRPSRTFELGGKMDALIGELDGLDVETPWLMEHKTTSEDLSPGSDYWRRLRMDGQVSLYYNACRHLGYDVQGCIYDVARRPLLRPYKATPVENRKYKKDGTLHANMRENDETPEEFRARVREHIVANVDQYYARGKVTRLESEVRDAQWDVWHTAKMLRETELADRHVRNPGACMQWGRTCEYFDVCTGAADLDDPTKFRRLETVHPELQEQSNGEEQRKAS